MNAGEPTNAHERWDRHWYRVFQDALAAGLSRDNARQVADLETEMQFGPRPA